MNNSTKHYFSTFKTPAGKFSVAVNTEGSIVATAFGDKKALQGRIKGVTLSPDSRKTAAARKQVEAWFMGRRQDFSVSLSPAGSPFQKKVWAALVRIPFGKTASYGEIARAIGSAPRAVGRANATNPICLIVPCHRVIGADGTLTGFAFGEDVKRKLLAFEAA
jgi:methylated-DNA-[protein]-cysteine S-methyltransferase